MEQTPSTNGNACSTCSAWWRLPLLLALVLVTIIAIRNRGIREGDSPAGSNASADGSRPVKKATTILADTPDESAVSLSVDFGDGNKRDFERFAWWEEMTVGDLLEDVRQSAQELRIEKQGTGDMAFLTRIGEVSNEGSGGRNWMYRVNGERGDRSYAVYPLRAGDRVLWEFDQQR